MEEATTTETEPKKLKAKSTSLVGQIFAAVWLAGWSAYKFITSGSIQVSEVMMSGLGIVACFSPVYFSIMLDKIKAIKIGDAE